MYLGILDGSAGEFEDTEEVYEAVGEVLLGISEKSEDDIRFVKLLLSVDHWTWLVYYIHIDRYLIKEIIFCYLLNVSGTWLQVGLLKPA